MRVYGNQVHRGSTEAVLSTAHSFSLQMFTEYLLHARCREKDAISVVTNAVKFNHNKKNFNRK
jgi:hypothetical protein